MKGLLVFILACTYLNNYASDKIFLISGDSIQGKVIGSDEFKLTYKPDGSDTNAVISKKAVNKISLENGSSLMISDKIIVSSRSDWEKVTILLDKSQIVGLRKVGEMKGRSSGNISGYVSGSSIDKTANRKILEDAAEMGCPFIYISNEKSLDISFGKGPLRKFYAYSYN